MKPMNELATNPTQMCLKPELEVYQSLSPFYDRIPARNYLGERGISSISSQLFHFIVESLLSLPAGKGGQLKQVVAMAMRQGSHWLPHSASQRPDCSARTKAGQYPTRPASHGPCHPPPKVFTASQNSAIS